MADKTRPYVSIYEHPDDSRKVVFVLANFDGEHTVEEARRLVYELERAHLAVKNRNADVRRQKPKKGRK